MNKIFSGHANIDLQGNEAYDIDDSHAEHLEYSITGVPTVTVIDHRQPSRDALGVAYKTAEWVKVALAISTPGYLEVFKEVASPPHFWIHIYPLKSALSDADIKFGLWIAVEIPIDVADSFVYNYYLLERFDREDGVNADQCTLYIRPK